MPINTYWVIYPCVVSLGLLYAWARLKTRRVTPVTVTSPSDPLPPPIEVPITSISSMSSTTSGGNYKVTFATTGNTTPYWISATDIIKRCVRHQQQIPYLVRADKSVTITSTDHRLHLGDALLIHK